MIGFVYFIQEGRARGARRRRAGATSRSATNEQLLV